MLRGGQTGGEAEGELTATGHVRRILREQQRNGRELVYRAYYARSQEESKHKKHVKKCPGAGRMVGVRHIQMNFWS